MPASGHQAVRRTNDRIAMNFYFPGQWQRVKTYCDSCNIREMRALERRTDLVPIRPIDRHEGNFGHLKADNIGPMVDGLYKYALVLTDVQSRYVTAFELTTPSAKNVVDKIILHSSYFGLPRYISCD
jgi:Integrase zinc binding domain